MNNINRNNRVSTTNEGTIDKKGEKSEQKSTAKGKKKNFFIDLRTKKSNGFDRFDRNIWHRNTRRHRAHFWPRQTRTKIKKNSPRK